jgi:ankyrin repeat protein
MQNLSDAQDQLVLALESSSNLFAVREALERGADPNGVNYDVYHDESSHSITPLVLAASTGFVDASELLLEYGAKIDGSADDGQVPLVEASKNGFYESAALLLARGAQVDQKDYDGLTALSAACEAGHLTIVELLIRHGADVNLVIDDEYGFSPLLFALESQNYEITRLLLRHGASPAVRSATGLGVFSTIGTFNTPLFDLLLSYGAPLWPLIAQAPAVSRELRERYVVLDAEISTIGSVQGLINMLTQKSAMGDIVGVNRALCLVGNWSYPRDLFEPGADPEPFYVHLSYFRDWLKKNPTVLGKQHVNESEILEIFKKYLSDLATRRPRFQYLNIHHIFSKYTGIPREVTDHIVALADPGNLGLVDRFHWDLAQEQAQGLKRLHECSAFNSEPLPGRTLVWSKRRVSEGTLVRTTLGNTDVLEEEDFAMDSGNRGLMKNYKRTNWS